MALHTVLFYTWAEQCALHSVSLQPLDGNKGKRQAGGHTTVFMVYCRIHFATLEENIEKMWLHGAEMHKNVYFLHMQVHLLNVP